MSADLLREAAALMRSRATAATPGPWTHDNTGPGGSNMGCGEVWSSNPDAFGCDVAEPGGDLYPRGPYSPTETMEHIASWHPDVALAVADWLDGVRVPSDPHTEAEAARFGCGDCANYHRALRVARAYLGRES